MKTFLMNFLSDVLQTDKISETDNLLSYGINSIHLMKLAGLLKAEKIDVSFLDLIREPTLESWVTLCEKNQKKTNTETAGQVQSLSRFPLTNMQKAYLWGRDASVALGGISCHAYVEFEPEEKIDLPRLNTAYQKLLQRHGALRTKFYPDGTQEILSPASFHRNLMIYDFENLTKEQLSEQLAQVRKKHSHKMLNVFEGEVIELVVSRLPEGMARIHLGLDLLVADVVSFKMILDDLTDLYENPDSLGILSWNMQEYLEKEKQLVKANYEADKRYWMEKAADMPVGSGLPLKNNPASIHGASYRRLQFELKEEEYKTFRQIAAEKKTTIAMVLLSLYAWILGRYSGRTKVLINLPVFNRDLAIADTDKAVADFTDLILVSADMKEIADFSELLGRIQNSFYDCMAHNTVKGMEVEKMLSSSGDAVIPAPIVFSCTEGVEQFSHKCTAFLGKPVFIITQTPQVYIDFQTFQNDKDLMCIWDIPDSLFPDGIAEAMFDILKKGVRKFVNSGGNMSGDDLESLFEKYEILPETVETESEKKISLLDGFYKNVKECPNRIALIDASSEEALTYRDLAFLIAHMSRKLKEVGVSAGDKIALTVNRGIKEIISILSILTVGACYVPITPNQPSSRRKTAMKDMKIRFAVVDAENMEKIPDETCTILFEKKKADSMVEPECVPEESAYVILTSGTTGIPKGVEITHAAAMNTIMEVNDRLDMSENDTVLNVSSIDFDLSVYDIFGTLTAGGRLVVTDQSHYRDALEWLRILKMYHVTIWNSVPMLFDMLLTVAEEEAQDLSLKAVLLSGDWVSSSLFTRMQKNNPQTRFIGLGGATEASIWSNWYEVRSPFDLRGKFVPYGWALKNQRYRIVNENLENCPVGVPGELQIGGLGLARCYCEDPIKTEEKFIVHKGMRWYRTGDRGCFDTDGCIRFLGRMDKQCKVRGHRIEVGEIEKHLRTYFQAEHVVCWPCGEDGIYNHLEACVYKKDLILDEQGEKLAMDYLKKQLPAYMVPTVIYVQENAPLSANGKFDRKQATEKQVLAKEPEKKKIAMPDESISSIIKKLWCENLDISDSAPDDNYYFQGGDSLKAIKLTSRINKSFGIHLSTAELLEAQTLGELIDKIIPLVITKEASL